MMFQSDRRVWTLLRRLFRRILLVISITLLGNISVQAQPSGTAPMDYVLIIDASGSMHAPMPELNNITRMRHVKDVAIEWASQIDVSLGIRAFVYTFNTGIQSDRQFVVDGGKARNNLVDYIEGLEAGDSTATTWLYRSLNEIVREHTAANTPVLILLYTDGKDTQDPPLDDVIRSLNDLESGRDAHVYYMMIGLDQYPDSIKTEVRQKAEELAQETDVELRLDLDVFPSILTLRPRQRLLNFGNFTVDDRPRRIIHLYSDNAVRFPEDLNLRLDARFPGLSSASGGMVESAISPGIIAKAALVPSAGDTFVRVELELNADNIENVDGLDGEFHGTISLESNDWTVFVVPDTIHAVLRYEAERTVTVTPSPDDEIDFGELDPLNREVHPDTSSQVVLLFEYNEPAQTRGGELMVEVRPNLDENYNEWTGVEVFLNGIGRQRLTVSPGTDSVTLAIVATDAAAHGNYSFHVTCRSNDMTVRGHTEPINGEFTVKRPVAPWWVFWLWLTGSLLLLLIILCIAYSLFIAGEDWYCCFGKLALMLGLKKLTFQEGTLIIRTPKEMAGEEFSLAGRESAVIGDGGDFLGIASGYIVRLTPVAVGDKTEVAAEAEAGDIRMREQGDGVDLALSQTRLYDGDEFTLGEYKVQFSSHRLIRI